MDSYHHRQNHESIIEGCYLENGSASESEVHLSSQDLDCWQVCSIRVVRSTNFVSDGSIEQEKHPPRYLASLPQRPASSWTTNASGPTVSRCSRRVLGHWFPGLHLLVLIPSLVTRPGPARVSEASCRRTGGEQQLKLGRPPTGLARSHKDGLGRPSRPVRRRCSLDWRREQRS
jgi:hypothetical protein